MDIFKTIARQWPSGGEIDLGVDSNPLTVPSSPERTAAKNVTSSDGSGQYKFLFWNTGRHITSKRKVRWNFTVGGWGLWTATRWYGTPGNGGGAQRVHVDGFTIGGDQVFTDTPIDSSSTYAAGAWPYNGNDHEIGTAGGAVDVVAKDPFHSREFAGWLKLVWGGDDTDEFIETDTGGSPGSSTFFEHAVGSYAVAKGGSADLLAAYGNSTAGGGGGVPPWDRLVIAIIDSLRHIRRPEPPGDPFRWERFREELENLLRQTKPGAGREIDFQRLIEEAPRMTKEQLREAMQAVQTSMNIGNAAYNALKSALSKMGG